MNIQELLLNLVSIKSISGEEKEIADFVFALALQWGFTVNRIGHNVFFEIGKGSPRLLIASHLDTIPACAGWKSDPLKPTWKDNKLIGLGANDAKGCVASILEAARALKNENLFGSVLFAFTAEEETGGTGGMEALLPNLGRIDAALVSEPTCLAPCIAQRGMLVLTCTAKGESTHVANGNIGENAIHKAARDISRISKMNFEPHDLLGVTKPQITIINGGISANQIPDSCTFTLDLRTTPNLDHAVLFEEIEIASECLVTVRSSRYKPKITSPDSIIAKAALAASGQMAFVGSATASDWAFLGDIPTIKIGPGDTHRSHCPNEYLLEEELKAGAAFYERAVKTFLVMTEKKEASCVY